METEFWHERWASNEIGFHQNEINPYLQRYWSRVGAPPGSTVFVPLCGKSRDMLWLQQQGHPIVGVELSSIAVEAFFKENGLKGQQTETGHFTRWQSGTITLLCGDFFDLKPQDLAGVSAVYDRASLVALPPAMRPRYRSHLRAILPRTCKIFLVSFEYPQEQMNGPPFAVKRNEIFELYQDQYAIEELHQENILAANPRFQERGLTSLTEHVYQLTPR